MKNDSNLYRFKHYKYGITNYSTIGDFYIVLDKDKHLACDSRNSDLDIEKYLDYKEFNEKEFNILSSFLIDRMLGLTHFKPN